MKIQITEKNESYTSCYTHPFGELHGTECYCRAVNQMLEEEKLFCGDCPLMVYDADNRQYFGCLYFDTAPSKKETDFERIGVAIENHLLPEFPYYLDDGGNHLVEHAFQYAAQAHKGVMRKGVAVPYIAHVIEAAGIVSTMSKSYVTIAAAALHDILEDTDVSPQELETEFGGEILTLVQYQTEDKRKDRPSAETWEIRKQEALQHYKEAPLEAKKIALSDKLSNMRASLQDYEKMGHKMWEKFNQKDRKKQEWYYRSMLDALSELKESDAYKEYEKIVNQVFEL